MVVNSMIRDLIKNIKIDEAFYSSALVHSYGKVSNPTVSEIMDDLFVPHINYSRHINISYLWKKLI